MSCLQGRQLTRDHNYNTLIMALFFLLGMCIMNATEENRDKALIQTVGMASKPIWITIIYKATIYKATICKAN